MYEKKKIAIVIDTTHRNTANYYIENTVNQLNYLEFQLFLLCQLLLNDKILSVSLNNNLLGFLQFWWNNLLQDIQTFLNIILLKSLYF